MKTSQELIANVEALMPAITAAAHVGDETGQVSDEIIGKLIEAGVFSTIAPKVYGGYELDLETYSQIVQRISCADPSTGWSTSFLMGAAWRLLAFGREGQKAIYGVSTPG